MASARKTTVVNRRSRKSPRDDESPWRIVVLAAIQLVQQVILVVFGDWLVHIWR